MKVKIVKISITFRILSLTLQCPTPHDDKNDKQPFVSSSSSYIVYVPENIFNYTQNKFSTAMHIGGMKILSGNQSFV
jgi:hypothetical protein